jgi:gamma-butyrobetaine dioxygenase
MGRVGKTGLNRLPLLRKLVSQSQLLECVLRGKKKDRSMAIAKARLSDRGLFLSEAPGDPSVEHYFNYLWLRDNCSTSWSPQTRDRTFDIFAQPLDLKPELARIDETALEILWQDGHVSRYELEWLFSWSVRPGRIDPADIPQRRWRADHTLARFDEAALRKDETARARMMETLIAEGAAIVEALPDTDAALTALAERIGSVRASFSGMYFDVMAKPDPRGVAYTAHALEPHTDSPCEEMPPGIQFLHCRANTTKGGESTLVDGAAVAQVLREKYPRDFELLSSTTIPFRFSHVGLDMRARQRVIEVDRRGVVTGVTISQHMADVFDLDQTQLDEFYPAFCRFGTLLRDPRFVLKFLLRAGECMVFDNHRIVHGRLAYDRQSGTRYLRGCYTDRGELRSKFRTIKRDARTAADAQPMAAT